MNIDTSGIAALEELHKKLVSVGLEVSSTQRIEWISISHHPLSTNVLRKLQFMRNFFTGGYGQHQMASDPQAEVGQLPGQDWEREGLP